MGEIELTSASVKVMNSYDYCHFEISLSSDSAQSIEDINEMRKEAQRLVDKAIAQYKFAKIAENKRLDASRSAESLRTKVKAILENFPKSEWTPEQKAQVQALKDADYWANRIYDYEDEDDWHNPY